MAISLYLFLGALPQVAVYKPYRLGGGWRVHQRTAMYLGAVPQYGVQAYRLIGEMEGTSAYCSVMWRRPQVMVYRP